jgi:hypothetical protein
LDLYSSAVQAELIRKDFGRDVPSHAISQERKNDYKLNKRINDLRRFACVPPANVNRHAVTVGDQTRIITKLSEADINQRVDKIGSKLVELKAHIEQDSSK